MPPADIQVFTLKKHHGPSSVIEKSFLDSLSACDTPVKYTNFTHHAGSIGPACFPEPLSLMALEGLVYNSPVLLEAISRDATCSLRRVVKSVNGRLIKVQL